jgi:hypothetical protein
MTGQDRQADSVKTPKMGPFGYLHKEPTEKERVEGNQYERMGEISVVFDIELTVEKTEHKIGVRKGPHGQTGDRSPVPNFFVMDGLRYNRTGKSMGNTVHKTYDNWEWMNVANRYGESSETYHIFSQPRAVLGNLFKKHLFKKQLT